MNNLEKLYNIIEYSRDTGVKLNKDVLRQVEEQEEKIIKEEILPALSQDIAPRLNPIKRELVLVVEYHPGEPISVALSRKAKISDFTDAKPLTPSRPVTSGERPAPSDMPGEPTKHVENPTKGLRVTFADGTTICHTTAIDTFIAAMRRIGYERVARLGITSHGGYNIVSHEMRPMVSGRTWQHESDGWYIYSNISNEQKKKYLKQISDAFHLGLRIEDGKPSKD